MPEPSLPNSYKSLARPRGELPGRCLLRVRFAAGMLATTTLFGLDSTASMSAIEPPLSRRSRVDGVVTFQVDAVLLEKIDEADEKALQRLRMDVEKAQTVGGEKAIDLAERALRRTEERIASKRHRVVVGRTAVVISSRPGNIGPTYKNWTQEPCAVLIEGGDKKVDQLNGGEFLTVTRIAPGIDHSGRGPGEAVQAMVNEPILNGFTHAYMAKAWKLSMRPDDWPVDVCETPWIAPSEKLTAEAKLEVTVLPEKFVYQFRDRVRYMLNIRNAGDKQIKSANIWFVFKDAAGAPVYVQRCWAIDDTFAIVEPRVKDLAPGAVFTIQTYATKSVDAQAKSIDVVVLSLTR